MKKSLMFAAILAAGFMASCSNEDKSFDAGNNDADKTPILFTMNNGAVDVTTRGTGAVGDVAGSTNVWRSEKLYVSMFQKGTNTLAIDEYGTIFDRTELTAPASTAAANSGVAEYEGYKYYPQTGNYDFFAFHISDAADVADVNDGKLDVTIDGSQDLMVAKADMTEEQKMAFEAAVDPSQKDRYYSAFSARRDVQPHFQFEHLLSRLVFTVEPTESSKDKVTVKAIKVRNAKTQATMVVSYVEKPEQLLIPAATVDSVYLKERVAGQAEAYDLQVLTPKTYSEKTRVGESLLLIPQEEYLLEIQMSQETPEGKVYDFSYHHTLKAPNTASFVAGNQYNVNFTIYGIEQIKLDVTLTPWADGGNIDINNDDIN